MKDDLVQLMRIELVSGDPAALARLLGALANAFKCMEAINSRIQDSLGIAQRKLSVPLKSVVESVLN